MPIEIKGLDKLFKKLDAVQAIQVLEKPMARSLFRLMRPMQSYPAPPPDSTYTRTGTYGRRWRTKVTSSANGVVGKVGNNVAYAPYVGSRMFQANVHRGRWTTDADAVQQNEAAIVDDFKDAIDRALAS